MITIYRLVIKMNAVFAPSGLNSIMKDVQNEMTITLQKSTSISAGVDWQPFLQYCFQAPMHIFHSK